MKSYFKTNESNKNVASQRNTASIYLVKANQVTPEQSMKHDQSQQQKHQSQGRIQG